MTGIVQGGWEFVAAAYVLSAVVLGGYTTSVFLRYRTERRRAAAEAQRETGT
jgi:hypothetical protein